MKRLSLDEYFMTVAVAASLRSTCRVKHGAVAVAEGHSRATGYNGSHPGEPHCCDVGCDMRMIRERERCVRTVHAEVNALERGGRGADTLYSTGQPCLSCWNHCVVWSQISALRRVVWWQPYSDLTRDEVWDQYEGPIEIVQLDYKPILQEILNELAGLIR